MKFYIFFTLLLGVHGNSLFEDSLYKDAIQIVHECGSRSLTICLKEKALKYVERLPNNIDIGNGLRIKQTETERFSRKHTPIPPLPAEATVREAVLDKILLDKIGDYLSSHTFEYQMPIDEAQDITERAEEARKKGGGGGGGGKKGGKKGSYLPLLMMIKFKVATLAAVALKLIGLAALKALLIAKVALTISGIIALKKLLEHKHHSSTYEVVAHPHVDDYGHHDRAFELPYRGHKPTP